MENLEAGAAIAAGEGEDNFGRIETRGIDMIPEIERKSKPRELFSVFFGPQFGYGNMLFGALPIAFGLGWWAAFFAITIGSLAGSLIFTLVTPVSPKTGTNMQVSSGAAFGVRGRLLGSGITWFIAIGFAVILVFTSGEAIIYTFNRWLQTSTSNTALSIAMVAVLIVTCVSAVLGHRTLERSVRVITISAIIVGHRHLRRVRSEVPRHPRRQLPARELLADLVHRPRRRRPPAASPGARSSATTAVTSLPTLRRSVTARRFFGIFLGAGSPCSRPPSPRPRSSRRPATSSRASRRHAPSWFLFPMLLVLGLGSNIASAGMSIYNAALDIGSWPFFFKIKRWQIATGLSAIAFGLTYLLVIVTNFLTNLESFVTIMVVTATPWMVIVGIHYLMNRGNYNTIDLHAFAMPGLRGRYWYSNGLNPRALVAWGGGVALGLMFSTTTLFTGPLENSVKGVDLSWLMAALGGGIIYYLATLFSPNAGKGDVHRRCLGHRVSAIS